MSELSRATAQYISNREMGVDRTGDRKGLHLSLGEASPTPQDVPLPFGGLSSDVGEVSICCSTSLVLWAGFVTLGTVEIVLVVGSVTGMAGTGGTSLCGELASGGL